MESLVKTMELHKGGEFESMVSHMVTTKHVVEKMLDLLVKEEKKEENPDASVGVVDPEPEFQSESIPEQCVDESKELFRRLQPILLAAKNVTCLVNRGKPCYIKYWIEKGYSYFRGILKL